MTTTTIEREERERADRLEEARRRAAESAEANRAMTAYSVTVSILSRWKAAGYTSAHLVDGIPRPLRPHPAAWTGDGMFRRCASCGHETFHARCTEVCPGKSAHPLVCEAVLAGVPFGLDADGLPTAGLPVEPGDVAAKLARATCSTTQRAA